MDRPIAVVQTPFMGDINPKCRNASYSDMDKCCHKESESTFLRFCRKHTSSLPSDCKPWKIADITLLSCGYFAILDSANIRLKIFNAEFVHICSKVIPDESHSLTSLQGEKIYVMDNTSVQYYRFNDSKTSFEDKFLLTGMHYGICSDGIILCLVKLTTLVFKNENFDTLRTVNFKSELGYTPANISFDGDSSLVFFNDDSKCVICWNKHQEEKWRADGIDSCIGIQKFRQGWIVYGVKEVTIIKNTGKVTAQSIVEQYFENLKCIVVDNVKKKLFVSDLKNIYDYDLDLSKI